MVLTPSATDWRTLTVCSWGGCRPFLKEVWRKLQVAVVMLKTIALCTLYMLVGRLGRVSGTRPGLIHAVLGAGSGGQKTN